MTFFITDTHHAISRANRAMARRCGLRPEELPGVYRSRRLVFV